ncbi:MAG TPA: oligosaccharide flippase family protein [Terriglobales bacterium]|nr:oligosaccharide flippase family protein [Terriglobales bacterium]
MKRSSSVLRYGGFAFSVGGARVAGILISSLTFPYLVRHLGVEMYGLWSYVVALCAFLNIVADPGLTSYASQQVAAQREGGIDLVPDVIALRVLFSAIAAIVLLAVASFEVRSDIRHLLRLYGVGLLIVNLLTGDAFLTALEMFHIRSLLVISQQAIYALGIFAFVHTPKDVIWLPISILGSSVVSGLVGWCILWGHGFRPPRIVRPRRWKRIVVPSGHYALSTLMSNLYHRSGHIVVRWFLGDHALGLYAAAVRLLDLLRSFVIIVLQVLNPRMALFAKSEAGLNRVTRFAVVVIALVSLPLTAGLISTAHLVVPLVLGPHFLEDVSLMKIMAFFLITASAASLTTGSILYSMGRHRAYLASTAGGAAAGVILYLTLIPTMGLAGAGLAFVLAEFVVAAIGYALLPPALHNLWKDPIVGVALASSLLMAVAVRIVSAYVPQVFVVVATGVFVYVGSCGWFVRKWFIEQFAAP